MGRETHLGPAAAIASSLRRGYDEDLTGRHRERIIRVLSQLHLVERSRTSFQETDLSSLRVRSHEDVVGCKILDGFAPTAEESYLSSEGIAASDTGSIL